MPRQSCRSQNCKSPSLVPLIRTSGHVQNPKWIMVYQTHFEVAGQFLSAKLVPTGCKDCAVQRRLLKQRRHNSRMDVHAQAEVHRWASELARLHERRDKEIVEIQRYEMVQGIVHQDPSTNRFHVCCSQPSPAGSEDILQHVL